MVSFLNGRDDTIRTCDPLVPSEVRYQTALQPEDDHIQFSSYLFYERSEVLPLLGRYLIFLVGRVKLRYIPKLTIFNFQFACFKKGARCYLSSEDTQSSSSAECNRPRWFYVIIKILKNQVSHKNILFTSYMC